MLVKLTPGLLRKHTRAHTHSHTHVHNTHIHEHTLSLFHSPHPPTHTLPQTHISLKTRQSGILFYKRHFFLQTFLPLIFVKTTFLDPIRFFYDITSLKVIFIFDFDFYP